MAEPAEGAVAAAAEDRLAYPGPGLSREGVPSNRSEREIHSNGLVSLVQIRNEVKSSVVSSLEGGRATEK